MCLAPRAIKNLATPRRRLLSFLAFGVGALVLGGVKPLPAEEMYDSGWAVAASPLGSDVDASDPDQSVLGQPRVPVEELLPPGSLERIVIPPKKPLPKTPVQAKPKSSGNKGPVEWQPRRTAQRPKKDQSAKTNKPPAPKQALPSTAPQVEDSIGPLPLAPPLPPGETGTADGDASASPEQEIREPAPFPGFSADEGPELDLSPAPRTQPPRKAKRPTITNPSPKRAEPEQDSPGREEPAVETPVDEEPAGELADGLPLYTAPAKPTVRPAKPLSKSQQYLRRRLRSVLSYYYRRPLTSRDHDPWEVMHGMLAYGLHSRVLDQGMRNKPVTAVGHLCFNKPCKRKRLLHLNQDGQLDADVAYGIQGHKGQFLAMLAQCKVSPEYPIRVEGQEFTIRDLIRAEQRTCYEQDELTFKLIALMHYLQSDATWVNADGEPWSISKLIRIERNQKIRGAPCGGTHRLSGLSLAARKREERGEPLDGEFLEAQKFVAQHQNLAFRLQNRDGSLSTEWFRGRGEEEDINRRVRTTGHLLEWLIYSLPDEKLTDYRVVRAVNYLTSLLASNTDNPWEAGPLSHGLHALLLYDERVFRPHDAPPQQVAQKNASGKRGSSNRSATPNYRNISSRVYGSYPSSEMVKEAIEKAESRGQGPLRALFGIGSTKTRRSR